jgi:YHS domain-containing protein
MVSWLIRAVFFLLLLYVFMWLLKKMFRRPAARTGMQSGRIAVNELVQDPVCKVYLPRQEALCVERGGKKHYFCSRECRRRYAERRD